MIKKILDNDTFVKENLEKLVEKYPRQKVVICQGEIFTGEDAVEKAKNKYPHHTPMWFPVPGPEEFMHIL